MSYTILHLPACQRCQTGWIRPDGHTLPQGDANRIPKALVTSLGLKPNVANNEQCDPQATEKR